jgi:transcriptional regulator NrdR family protein
MMCPRCGHESHVVDTGRGRAVMVPRDAPQVWRRRQCLSRDCAYRWNTVEIEERRLKPRDKSA